MPVTCVFANHIVSWRTDHPSGDAAGARRIATGTGQYIIGTLTVTLASGVSRVTPTPSVKFKVRLSLKR